jgi:hypothetical protein
MALRYFDNFDYGVTADLADRGWTLISTPIISAGNGRNSTASLRVTPLSSIAINITRTIDAQATWIVGFSFRTSLLPPSAAKVLASLIDAGTVQCSLMLNVDGTLSVVRGVSTALTSGTSVTAVVATATNYVEWKCTIADSIGANTCKVRLNGSDIITVATSQDTKSTANATANQVFIGTNNAAGSSGNWDYDDLYICDGTGSVNNDFLGDVKGVTSLPAGAGNSTQFTPSAGSNYQNVDDAAPDDDTTYNESSTVGHVDSFATAPLTATPTTIHGVAVSINVKKTDAGTANVACSIRSGGTTYFGTTTALTTTYTYVTHVWETDPATGVAWTRSGVDSSEAGYKYIS